MPHKPQKKIRPWERKADDKPHARRTNPNREVYNTRRWQKVRALYLADHPFCECSECKARPVPLPANVVDHIVPINQGGDPWDDSNFQAMNSRCHNRKSGREAHEYNPHN